MKLYLVSQAREAVPQIFKDHGLKTATPSKASEVPILPLTRPSFPYLLNLNSFHAHLNAEIKNTITHSDNFDFVLSKVPVSVTFEAPPLRLVFSGLSAGEKDTLIQLGLSADTANVFTGQLPVSAIQEVSKMKPQSETYRAGTVDWDGYVAWTFYMRFLTFFSYASQSFNQPITLMVSDDVERVAPGGKVRVTSTGPSGREQESVVPAKVAAIRIPNAKVIIAGGKQIKTFVFSNLLEMKPEQLSLHNLLLPFFDQMVLPDAAFTFGTLMTLFGTMFGDSPATPGLIAMIKRGTQAMAFTAAGKAISHAMLCVQMATQAGTAIRFIVHRGVYHGSLLSSAQPFSFMLGSVTYKSEGPQETMDDLESMDQHTHALRKISEILTGKIVESDVITVTMEDIKTSRQLLIVLHSHLALILSDKETKDAIEAQVELLRFMDKYEEPSQAAIIDFLDYMLTGDENLIAHKPAFLKGGRWMKTSRADKGLSVFGPLAPSLNWGADKKDSEQKKIPLVTKAADLFTSTPTRAALYLPYKVIAVNGASSQWQMLFKSGTLALMPGRKDKKEVFNLTGTKANITGQFAETIWVKLNQIHALEKLSKKRKGDTKEKGEENPGQKKAKVDIDSLLF